METETLTRPRAAASGEVIDAAPATKAQQPLAVRDESADLARAIIAAANDPAVNVEKIERLQLMYERISARNAEQQFNAGMVAAQSQMARISADAVNPQTRSRYATYAQLDRHVRPIYTSQGFSLSFDSGDGAPEGHVRVLCYVSHAAGHTRTYRCDMPSDGKGAKGNDVMTKTHASGSAMSYGMRYLLKLIFNVAIGEDDDDGNGAGHEAQRRNQRAGGQRQAAPASEELRNRAYRAADGGRAAFGPFWAGISREERGSLGDDIADLKVRTEAADKANPQQARAAQRDQNTARHQQPAATQQAANGTRTRAPAPRR